MIKINRFNNAARDTLDEWVYFLKNEEICDGFTARGLDKAKEQLDILKLSGPERESYERYKDDLHYQASMVLSTYGIGKLEGEQRGEQKGKAEMLTRLLQRRFGTVPDWASEKVAKAQLPSLENWSLRIFDAQSLDDIFLDKA